ACQAAAGWAEWAAEWISKPIAFRVDFARKAPNSGAFFVSADGTSIAAHIAPKHYFYKALPCRFPPAHKML
ncbi:MAG TPA: hypothetical protein VGP28_08820, partial [Methylocella sp.]|nr:hypothetical protein [Methylocella sp.]